MCGTCGCSATDETLKAMKPEEATTVVSVMSDLLAANDKTAAHNREHFDRAGVLCVNLMSSPGAGKTALLEATIEALKQAGGENLRVAVIEGDLETENDAERIRAKGVPAHQITTGSACHLDAKMVHRALHHMDLSDIDILFIENVGNLVCPASFDLGHHLNVTLLSATEGEDKPAKYPVMFRGADLVLFTKSDLLSVLDDFDPVRAEEHVRRLANLAPCLQLSARRPETLTPWLAWLEEKRAALKAGAELRPQMQPDGAAMHLAAAE